MNSQLCAVIKGATDEEIQQQMTLVKSTADIIEWRLDCFASLDLKKLERLRKASPLPLIFTLRPNHHGGNFTDREESRLKVLEDLLLLTPEFVDIESDVPQDFIIKIKKKYPLLKIISSFHDVVGTPTDLDAIFNQMYNPQIDFYKIAVTANTTLDAMRLMEFVRHHSEHLIAISMGECGQFTRIVGALVGSKMTYAFSDSTQQTASGQLSLKDLVDIYHYKSLKVTTKLYGLIGETVDKSIGHLVHNSAMWILGVDAVYVKMQVKPVELKSFLTSAKHLNFGGLSVTMPLKEAVLAYLDHIDDEAKQIGAVNTLRFDGKKISGYNTDGIGALNVIEKKLFVKDQTVVIIGAGGAARAIVYEAKKRGGRVIIVNRHAERGKALADHFGCVGGGMDLLTRVKQDGYAVMINATPDEMPVPSDAILPGTLVMDIKTFPIFTEFLQHAIEKKCQIIPGYLMFIDQAVQQVMIWFGNRLDVEIIASSFLSQMEQMGNIDILAATIPKHI